MSQLTSEVLAKALASGLTPLEILLGIARDETLPVEVRLRAAEKAAPYIHPRPSPASTVEKLELPDTSTRDGVAAALDKVIQAAAAGEISVAYASSFLALLEAKTKMIEQKAADARNSADAGEKTAMRDVWNVLKGTSLRPKDPDNPPPQNAERRGPVPPVPVPAVTGRKRP